MIGVYAFGTVKANLEKEFEALAQQFIAESRTHSGNYHYDCGPVSGKERTYCFIERWEDKAALDAHLATPFFQENAPKLVDMLENGLDINVVDFI